MTHEIRNPNPPLYFIAWCLQGETKDPIAYGAVTTEQWVTSGLDFIETFVNEADYLAALAENGITLEE